MQRNKSILIAILPALIFLAACQIGRESTGEFYTTWDKAGACNQAVVSPYGVSLAGEVLGMCDFPGEYVWVTYSAPWCGTSAQQMPHASRASRRFSDDARFIHVVSGGSQPLTAATPAEVRRWASRFSLRSVETVGEGEGYRVLPQHALVGPDGQTWYRYIGVLTDDQIGAILAEFRNGIRTPAPHKNFALR
jgi:thiol-disulfide isomerase/thioredoxin